MSGPPSTLSPEPVSNAAATARELGPVAAVAWAVWSHPWMPLAAALAIVAALFLLVRARWRAVARTARARFAPQPPVPRS